MENFELPSKSTKIEETIILSQRTRLACVVVIYCVSEGDLAVI